MIIEVKETVYKGILVEHVKDQGWKCNIGGQEYLFPNYVAAQSAIDEIFADIKPVVVKNKGKKLGKNAEAQKLNPQCDNCAEITTLLDAFAKHLENDSKYISAILNVLNEQKEAFQEKDYEYAEEILDALIAELKE